MIRQEMDDFRVHILVFNAGNLDIITLLHRVAQKPLDTRCLISGRSHIPQLRRLMIREEDPTVSATAKI